MTTNRGLARHAARFGIAALVADAAYTAWFWLILGRDERRTSKHAEVRYFLIIFQLAAEIAGIVHLLGVLRKVRG